VTLNYFQQEHTITRSRPSIWWWSFLICIRQLWNCLCSCILFCNLSWCNGGCTWQNSNDYHKGHWGIGLLHQTTNAIL